MSVVCANPCLFFRWSLLLIVFIIFYGNYKVRGNQVCQFVSEYGNPRGQYDPERLDQEKGKQTTPPAMDMTGIDEFPESRSSEIHQNQPWEMVSFQTLDVSSFGHVQGIIFDIVQHYQTTVEFSTLPAGQQNVEIRLLTRGPNSVLHTTHPELDIGVASLALGPRFRIEVGGERGSIFSPGGVLWPLVWTVVTMMVAFGVWWWWWRRRSRQKSGTAWRFWWFLQRSVIQYCGSL